MALGPCRECGKQVSDQAEACPSCGIRQPVIPSGPADHVSQNMADEPILHLNGVIVTKTLAKFPDQTFPINGIGSVRLVTTSPGKKGWITAALISGFWGLIILLVADSAGDDAVEFFAMGLCVMGLGGGCLLVGFSQKDKNELFIRTSSGDTKAMEGDAKALNTIKEAIERAATMRG